MDGPVFALLGVWKVFLTTAPLDKALAISSLRPVTNVAERRPGEYAHDRYRRSLKNYRRRIRWHVLLITVPSVITATAAAIWLDGDLWWWMAGLWTGGMLALTMWAFDDPPEYIAKWGRGADGERRTAKELRALEREGWRVEHDRQKRGYNLDHIAIGPHGRFLIETKAWAGTISIENGSITARYADDPDERFIDRDLHRRMKERARELWGELRADGTGSNWVRPVVVIWGSFPDEFVLLDKVAYVHGSKLLDFLRDPHSTSAFPAS